MGCRGVPSHSRLVAGQGCYSSLSSATVRVVHFVSPVVTPTPASSEGSFTPSSSLLSRSEALLVTCGVFSVLVDCPLDFRSLLPALPQGFPSPLASGVAEANSSEPEGRDSFPAVVPSAKCSSASVPTAVPAGSVGKIENGVRSDERFASTGCPVSDFPLLQSASLFSCALVRALLPLRLHAILITHPHGLLGLPLLSELVDLTETRVFVTPPVLVAADPALRFLRPWQEVHRENTRWKEETPCRGGEEGNALQGGEDVACSSSPLLSSQRGAASDNAGGPLRAAAGQKSGNTPLGVSSPAPCSLLGDTAVGERTSEGEGKRRYAAVPAGAHVSGERLLEGVGIPAQICPTMFWQERELLDDATQQRLQIHPVSSGFCLGGANWVMTSATTQKIFIVGPSVFDATGDNPSAQKGHVSEVPSLVPSPSAPGRAGETEGVFFRKVPRYPLGPDWSVLSEASLVIFFDCAPLPGSAASPGSPPLFRVPREPVSAQPHGGLSPSTPAAGYAAASSSAFGRARPCQAGHSSLTPALTSCLHGSTPHSLQSLQQRPLRHDSQGGGPALLSDGHCRSSTSLPASHYPPSCPLLPLSTSLRELSGLVLSTIRDRRGNVLLPIDLCGLLFLETIEILSAITSSSSTLQPLVPLYCVAPGLPGLLQFAAEGVEWMDETRAERTRDLQHPRPPIRLSTCFDEDLLLGGKSGPGCTDLSMRNRSVIAGECLADVMPLREPCVLLLSDASLRTGECALLLEKWKDEEKHLLLCVDRRFACRGDVRRPVRSSLPPRSSSGSDQAGSYHQFPRHAHAMEARGSCASAVVSAAASQGGVATQLTAASMQSPKPLSAGQSLRTPTTPKLERQGQHCFALGKTENEAPSDRQVKDEVRLPQDEQSPMKTAGSASSVPCTWQHSSCSTSRLGQEGGLAEGSASRQQQQQHGTPLQSSKYSPFFSSRAASAVDLFGLLLWPFLLDSSSLLSKAQSELRSFLERFPRPAGGSPMILPEADVESQASSSSRLFRMRVAVLPLDCRLDSSAILALLFQHHPQVAAFPAPVYAQVNRAVSLEGRSLRGLTRKPKRRLASLCLARDKVEPFKSNQSSAFDTLPVSQSSFPPSGGAACLSGRTAKGESADIAAAEWRRETSRLVEDQKLTSRAGVGGARPALGTSSEGPGSAFTTHLESLQPSAATEIQLEVGFSDRDAITLRKSFSVLHLEEASTSAAASGSGLEGSTRSCRASENFSQAVSTHLVPTRRFPSVGSTGSNAVGRRGRVRETLFESKGLHSGEAELAVGLIPSGAVLRGDGGGAGSGKGLLTLILPGNSLALASEDTARGGRRTSSNVSTLSRTDQASQRDPEAGKGSQQSLERESCERENVLLFGEYLPEQLLLALHDRGYRDAYVGPLRASPRDLPSWLQRDIGENHRYGSWDGPTRSQTAKERAPRSSNSSTGSLEKEGAPGTAARSGDSGEVSACRVGVRTELLATERAVEVTETIQNEKSPQGIRYGGERTSGKCSVCVPSLRCRVHCWDWNLTEIEAPDRPTRSFLRSLVGQLLANVSFGRRGE